jgi:ABC-type branched-subunit amino acid transport system permease subunit
MSFEHRSQPLLPRRLFVRRLARYGIYALAVIVVSLLIGMAGYHFLGHLGWTDAYLNAAMILTGMGPVDPMPSAAGKIFSGLYAIYSGVVFLSVVALMFTPIAHRLLHIFHLEGARKTS